MKHLFALLALVTLLPVLGNIVDDIKKAAESGDPFSQMQLAELYSVGRGVPMDANESMKWVRKAAEQGYPDGQYVLSRACRAGQGVAKDDKEAMRWLIKAAESGHMPMVKTLPFSSPPTFQTWAPPHWTTWAA